MSGTTYAPGMLNPPDWQPTGGVPGLGGLASNGIGDVCFSGGNGGVGFQYLGGSSGGYKYYYNTFIRNAGGGGGGSAGPNGNGGNGAMATVQQSATPPTWTTPTFGASTWLKGMMVQYGGQYYQCIYPTSYANPTYTTNRTPGVGGGTITNVTASPILRGDCHERKSRSEPQRLRNQLGNRRRFPPPTEHLRCKLLTTATLV